MELGAALNTGPGEFRLAYNGAEIIDRNPTPGVISAVGCASARARVEGKMVVVRRRYPEPPSEFDSLTAAQWEGVGLALRDDSAVVAARRAYRPYDWDALYKALEIIEDDIGGGYPRNGFRAKNWIG